MLSVLLVRLKLSLVDYALFFFLAVRVLETFLVIHLIDVSTSGFELIERKDLFDVLFFIAMPAQIIGICNLRFNYLITLPLTILSLTLINKYAYTTDNDNLSCFKNPEAKSESSVWNFILLVMVAFCYMYRRSTLENFIEQEKSKK